ncbi:hypothetical protein ACG7TL_007684 [Trametes sanguinea]
MPLQSLPFSSPLSSLSSTDSTPFTTPISTPAKPQASAGNPSVHVSPNRPHPFWKARLNASLTTVSFTAVPPKLNWVPYPEDVFGGPLPVDELVAYSKTHVWPDNIKCFCSLTNHIDTAVRIFTPRTGEHRGDPCLACPNWDAGGLTGCRYWVNLRHLFSEPAALTTVPLGAYPLRQRRSASAPPLVAGLMGGTAAVVGAAKLHDTWLAAMAHGVAEREAIDTSPPDCHSVASENAAVAGIVAVPVAIPAASMEPASSTGAGAVSTASVASAGRILLSMPSEEPKALPVAQAAIPAQSTSRTAIDVPEPSGSRVVKSVEDILVNIVSGPSSETDIKHAVRNAPVPSTAEVAAMWADLSKVGGEGVEYKRFMAAFGGCSTCNRVMTIDTILLHTCAGKSRGPEVGGSVQAAAADINNAERTRKRKIHPMPPSPRVLLKQPRIDEGSKGSSSVRFRQTGRITYELVEY